MKRFRAAFPWILLMVLICCRMAAAANPDLLAAGSGKTTVATVNGEPITLEEFRGVLDSLHQGVTENQGGPRKNYIELLQHIINAKLILQEARDIGLDTLPGVKESVAAYEEKESRGILLARQIKGTRPNEREVEKIYKESIREFKIRPYYFWKEEDAIQADGEIRSGSDFDNVMKRFVSEGKAEGKDEGTFLKEKDLLPEISEAVLKLTEGGISPPLKVSSGRRGGGAFTILKLEGFRYPESQEAKEQARKQVLQKQRMEAIRKYGEALKKKYVKIHQETLEGLDYESKDPGLEVLLEDQRVVADIRGEKSIRVADLSLALRQKFYHGVEYAAEGKKVNKAKREMLDEMLLKRVFNKEARRKKIDKSSEYKKRVKAYRDEVLFGAFVQNVIDPDVKLDETVIRKYYEEHEKEFLSPEAVRVNDLAFGNREDAIDALEKLRRGADFNWLKANALGQIDDKSRQRVPPLRGELYVKKDLPDGVREAVSGAGPGDVRLYPSPEEQFFVLYILEVIPSKSTPYAQLKEIIANRLFQEERQKSVEKWAEKLRAASEIRIFATEEEMEKMFVPAGAGSAKP